MKKSFGFFKKKREGGGIKNTDGTQPGHPVHSYIMHVKIFYQFLGHSWDSEEGKTDKKQPETKNPTGF